MRRSHMRKKLMVALVAGALSVAMVGGVASAAGNGYGKMIKDAELEQGKNYGQLKNWAWESGHGAPPAMGAKAFVEAHF